MQRHAFMHVILFTVLCVAHYRVPFFSEMYAYLIFPACNETDLKNAEISRLFKDFIRGGGKLSYSGVTIT